MATQPNLTKAEDALLEAHCEALDLLKEIHLALHDRPAPGCGNDITWEQVGTIREARNRLKSVLAFLNRTEV